MAKEFLVVFLPGQASTKSCGRQYSGMRLSQVDDEGCPAPVEVGCAPNLRKQG